MASKNGDDERFSRHRHRDLLRIYAVEFPYSHRISSAMIKGHRPWALIQPQHKFTVGKTVAQGGDRVFAQVVDQDNGCTRC